MPAADTKSPLPDSRSAGDGVTGRGRERGTERNREKTRSTRDEGETGTGKEQQGQAQQARRWAASHRPHYLPFGVWLACQSEARWSIRSLGGWGQAPTTLSPRCHATCATSNTTSQGLVLWPSKPWTQAEPVHPNPQAPMWPSSLATEMLGQTLVLPPAWLAGCHTRGPVEHKRKEQVPCPLLSYSPQQRTLRRLEAPESVATAFSPPPK